MRIWLGTLLLVAILALAAAVRTRGTQLLFPGPPPHALKPIFRSYLFSPQSPAATGAARLTKKEAAQFGAGRAAILKARDEALCYIDGTCDTFVSQKTKNAVAHKLAARAAARRAAIAARCTPAERAQLATLREAIVTKNKLIDAEAARHASKARLDYLRDQVADVHTDISALLKHKPECETDEALAALKQVAASQARRERTAEQKAAAALRAQQRAAEQKAALEAAAERAERAAELKADAAERAAELKAEAAEAKAEAAAELKAEQDAEKKQLELARKRYAAHVQAAKDAYAQMQKNIAARRAWGMQIIDPTTAPPTTAPPPPVCSRADRAALAAAEARVVKYSDKIQAETPRGISDARRDFIAAKVHAAQTAIAALLKRAPECVPVVRRATVVLKKTAPPPACAKADAAEIAAARASAADASRKLTAERATGASEGRVEYLVKQLAKSQSALATLLQKAPECAKQQKPAAKKASKPAASAKACADADRTQLGSLRARLALDGKKLIAERASGASKGRVDYLLNQIEDAQDKISALLKHKPACQTAVAHATASLVEAHAQLFERVFLELESTPARHAKHAASQKPASANQKRSELRYDDAHAHILAKAREALCIIDGACKSGDAAGSAGIVAAKAAKAAVQSHKRAVAAAQTAAERFKAAKRRANAAAQSKGEGTHQGWRRGLGINQSNIESTGFATFNATSGRDSPIFFFILVLFSTTTQILISILSTPPG
jgi:hypothetical protein